MLLSLPDETSESLPPHLILIVFLLAILSFSSIRDSSADSTLKFSAVSVFDDVSFQKSLEKALPLRSRAITGSSGLSGSKINGTCRRPGSSGRVFSTGGSALPSVTKVKLSPPLSDLTSAISIRDAPRPPMEPLGNSMPFRATLLSGAIYRFGSEDRDSRLAMDFFLPARLDNSTMLFFESRAEYQPPFSGFSNSANHRFDLGLGLGWRTVDDNGALFGVNTFWDASRLSGDWYSSPGIGLEIALPLSSGVWDLALNAYRGGGIDLNGGCTFPIWEGRLDMRLFAEKYRFFDGEFILGSKFGAEISSPDRLVTVSYAYGQDSRDPHYHALACSLAVPFRLENVLYGKNPFEPPERLDTKRRQSEGVKRAWRQLDTVVEARNAPQGQRWTTPGKLSELPEQVTEAPKDHAKTTWQPTDWERERSKKADESKSLGDQLVGWIAGAAAKIVVKATYACCDFAYRNAFGPFEIEPYEKDRIRQEIPKKQRRK